jgi:hypothetical protein|tara:strand:- start:258 stop:479 length:222 start_codon:yes stop_codon:yes gene_type:complete
LIFTFLIRFLFSEWPLSILNYIDKLSEPSTVLASLRSMERVREHRLAIEIAGEVHFAFLSVSLNSIFSFTIGI